MKGYSGSVASKQNENNNNMLIRRYTILVLAMFLCTSLHAEMQNPHTHTETPKKRVRMEMGVGLDAVYTSLNSISTTDIALSPRIGFGGHFDMGVCFGRNFAIETEVAYQRGSLVAKNNIVDHTRKVKTTTIDIPVLLSLRFINQHLRFIAGPVFTVMNRSQYAVNDQTHEFGPFSPTWNVAGGIALCMGGHFQLEARYIHPLKTTLNQVDGIEFESKASRITAGFSVVF